MYLKTAINADVAVSTIISELTSRIEAVTGSATLKEILLLTVATSLVTEDRVLTVPDLTTLSGMTNAIVGTVFFVESEGFPYIRKSNGNWIKIDPSFQKPALENAYAWGVNTYGALGDGTTDNKSSPVSVVGGFTDWVQLQSCGLFGIGIRANGTAWSWGKNDFGQLGDGTGTYTSSPVSVVGGFTDWVQLSGIGYSAFGVRANGTAWAWGSNSNGQLGDGSTTTESKSSPVSVVGGFTNWIQLSGAPNHTLGLRANGTVWAWGDNTYGQLGDNTTAGKSSPVSVVGGFADWTQVSSSIYISLGLRANGTAWGWGKNYFSQIGDGTTTNRSSPVSVVGGFADWTQVSAGGSHSLGLRSNGTAWAWGFNDNGQLGDGTTVSKSSPVSVVGGFTDWIQLSASGGLFSIALRSNGTAWAWGDNATGPLGDNTTTDRSSPVSVVGGFNDWISISAGLNSVGIRGS